MKKHTPSGGPSTGAAEVEFLPDLARTTDRPRFLQWSGITTPYSGITDAERQLLDDVRKHEVIHREFFKAALGAAAIPELQVTFASVDFTSRAAVLGAAK